MFIMASPNPRVGIALARWVIESVSIVQNSQSVVAMLSDCAGAQAHQMNNGRYRDFNLPLTIKLWQSNFCQRLPSEMSKSSDFLKAPDMPQFDRQYVIGSFCLFRSFVIIYVKSQ